MDAVDGPGTPATPDEREANKQLDPTLLLADLREIEFLDERITFFIGDYKAKRNKSRDLSNLVKIMSIVVGGLVTILIGLKSFLDAASPAAAPWVSSITLVLSAGLTSLGAWEAFADHRWKWIRYRATLSALYTIQDDFHFRQKGQSPLSAQEVQGFYVQMRNAVHETNQEWMTQRGNALRGESKSNSA